MKIYTIIRTSVHLTLFCIEAGNMILKADPDRGELSLRLFVHGLSTGYIKIIEEVYDEKDHGGIFQQDGENGEDG
jgi:hypothetical protein